MNKKLSLAIDVNTLISGTPNEEGIIIKEAVEYITKLSEDGYYIIITSNLTISENKLLIDLFNKYRLPYHIFNANPPTVIEFYREDPRKIVADVYIDAKGLVDIPLHWRNIYEIIISKWKQ